jgi:hypothetical protein
MALRRQNKQGEWVVAIPLPYDYVLFKRCGKWDGRNECQAKFFTRRGYNGHYALVHIVGHDYE